MSDLFWASYALVWVLVAVLVVLVLLLYRQFGLAFLGSGDRVSLQGPDLGSRLPALELTDPSSRRTESVELGADHEAGRWAAHLVLFALPACSICKQLAGVVGELPERWREVEFGWIDAPGPPASREAPRAALPADTGWRVKLSARQQAHEALDIAAVPFACLLDAYGELVAKRLVTTVEEIDALLSEHTPRAATGNGGRRSRRLVMSGWRAEK
jgi:hypothetical protein